ncbi:hypothetical protein [Deinococcus cellulosilyticus]|uniref:Lipoprotein n=1 Tax=Deinococcus cellulosilyticus (strain DSM 18568 / NBRC 106333 / KACC 11606 / 5516J-15) TaxID=1223518 RepID=A0A511N3C9_DEIC1|nr:hypothetical protein [Deinococcus cellulosilyticus]GEM47360.1 hypothetical protein DC3_29950 [Deinococcus cellulosilyticus NBRC 106333 = KACC 11606]
MNFSKWTLLLLIVPGLTSCMFVTPTQGVRDVHFQVSDEIQDILPHQLLTQQKVPRTRWMDIPEALRKAPNGSLILACSDKTVFFKPWGPCSHITRKWDDDTLAEAREFFMLNGFHPLKRLYDYHAVVILDDGTTPEQLRRMGYRIRQLANTYYDFTGFPGTYYCSTYQNELARYVGMPEPIPFNKGWNAYVPADVLTSPNIKVLYVGVQNPDEGKDKKPQVAKP